MGAGDPCRARSKEDSDDREADYTEEEWTRLRRAPFVAGLAISMADPGGPIEMAKETMATPAGGDDAPEPGGAARRGRPRTSPR
jgi:hypothetical protein